MEKTSPGRAFYQRQIALLEAGDIDGLMSQYHDDATVVGFGFTVHGAKAIRGHMAEYLGRLGRLMLKSTDNFTETDDSIFFEATVATGIGEARVYDVFMLRDGRATHHFTGVMAATPVTE